MSLSKTLFREKTNVPKKLSTTFNAPGTYFPQYGKTVVTISGRGTPGNATTGGTFAGTNPTSGGTFAGTNPAKGNNYAGTNPSSPGNSYTNTGSFTAGNYVPGNTNPGNYTPGEAVTGAFAEYATVGGYYDTTYNVSPGTFGTPYSTYSNAFDNNVAPPVRGITYSVNYSHFSSPGTFTPGNANSPYSNPNSFTPGNTSYNPTTPGNAYYNPTVPGNAYYNPTVPGNANYNPVVPGTAGSPVAILGITFPGGASDMPSPVIGDTPVSSPYTGNGVSITVPPGGYINVKNN